MLHPSRIAKTSRITSAVPHDDEPSSYAALIILDAAANVKFTYWNDVVSEEQRRFLCTTDARLAAGLEARVRGAIAATPVADVVIRENGQTLRLSPLDGQEAHFALVLEADRDDGKMGRAISRYQLTRRQSEVLALVLDGASASDVARALVISEYTAQGYVKCLLTKTASRNRAEMVAKVLDWKSKSRATLDDPKALDRARAS